MSKNRPVGLLSLVAGDAEVLPLQHLILNLLSFFALVAEFLFLVLDLLPPDLRWEGLPLDSFMMLVFASLYWVSRIRGHYTATSHFASLTGFLYQASNYANSGGSEGSSWIVAMMMMGIMALLHRGVWAYAYGLGALGVQWLCVGLDASLPGWVVPFRSLAEQRSDIQLTFVVTGLLLFFLIVLVMRFYGVANRRVASNAEQAERAEERLQLALDASGEGHWDYDLTNNSVFYSATWKSLLGYTDAELANQPGLAKRLTPPAEWKALTDYMAQQELAGADRAEFEFRMYHRSGRLVDILARTSIIRDGRGAIVRYVGTHNDVTQRNRMIRDLEASRTEADRANQAKSEFLASMSHELRTPLNSILGFGQVLKLDNRVSQDHRDLVGEMLDAGKHLLTLINDILDLARVESGKIELSLEPVELASVLEEIEMLIRNEAGARQLSLAFQPCGTLAVLADRVRLKQVLLNLASNAVKYNRPGGRVWFAFAVEAERVRISVHDTGQGIPASRLSELFVPFSRLGREAGDIQGSGIGLAHSRRLIALMNGHIGVNNHEAEGCEFWVDLPLVAAPVAPESALGVESAATPLDAAVRYKVLYIEDSPQNLKLVRTMLGSRPNIELVEAATALDGIDRALADPPALVLLDLNLPDLHGFDVVRRLRAEPAFASTPIVAVTANAMSHDLRKASDLGFAAYITKPIDVLPFLRTIDSLLFGEPNGRP